MVADCQHSLFDLSMVGLIFFTMVSPMYKFQVEAHTSLGETLILVGSIPSLGEWSVTKGLKLKTSGEKYPLWWTDRVDLGVDDSQRVEYKYVKVGNGKEEWEAPYSKANRWVSVENNSITVHDFWFGNVQKYPFGFIDPPVKAPDVTVSPGKLKIAVVGSSVACGCNAWELQGWAYHLREAVKEKYGHVVVNLAESGSNTRRTLSKFDAVVTPQKPDIVLLSLSLGNEGLFDCQPHDRKKVQKEFESGIQKLLEKIQSIGSKPVLCGLYPNGNCNAETYWLVKDTEKKLRQLGVPLIEWRSAVDNGSGKWKDGIFTDHAHPNSEGHRIMFQAIDLELFRTPEVAAKQGD